MYLLRFCYIIRVFCTLENGTFNIYPTINKRKFKKEASYMQNMLKTKINRVTDTEKIFWQTALHAINRKDPIAVSI